MVKDDMIIQTMSKLFFLLLICNVLSHPILFWNIRTFGVHRATPEVGEQLQQIVSPYDVLLFAEIRSWEGKEIRSYFDHYLSNYTMLISPPLHFCHSDTHSGSEEYGLFVKNTFPYKVEMVSYEDPQCKFIRRPFGLKIHSSPEYHILVFHSMPGNKQELILLDDVLRHFSPNVVLLGDLNTGCEYTSFSELNHFPIRSNYTWVLPDKKYTNFHLNCPYDRIIATYTSKNDLSFPKVLCNGNEASRIGSDHYPITVELHI
jgi:hypothetical protein